MKKAVMFGAGNIGRGFIGQLFSESGYEVVFIDINCEIVEKINLDRKYPIKIVSDKGTKDIVVNNVRAVDVVDNEKVSREIADAEIMATAVGVNNLQYIAAPIANGLKARWEKKNFTPLNIIICENLVDANIYMKDIIKNELIDADKVYLNELIGFVEASVGRMVPEMSPEMQDGNLLKICVEEYCELPVDRAGFKGKIPKIKNMVPFSPFEFYIKRKLFIHNMGHAITAYLGYLKGYQYIWEAVNDEDIRKISQSAMMESAQALSLEYGIELVKIQEHVDDLIYRFGNHELGDTVERVGRDLKRKLSPNDRLIGAFDLCIKNGIRPKCICVGISAAVCFKDPLAEKDLSILNVQGLDEAWEKIYGLITRM